MLQSRRINLYSLPISVAIVVACFVETVYTSSMVSHRLYIVAFRDNVMDRSKSDNGKMSVNLRTTKGPVRLLATIAR